MHAYFDTTLWGSTLPPDEYIANLKHKKLLLINIGGRYKYHLMKRIRALGVGHIVVLDTPDEWFSPLVDGTIPGDPITPLSHKNPQDDTRIQSILAYMQSHNIEFDGIWTIADKSVVLCAQIAHFFGKPGIPADIISQLKNKQTLREWLYDNRVILNKGAPHVHTLPRIDSVHVSEDDYPIILKGKESAGKSLIHIVHSQQELDDYIAQYGLDVITLEPYFEGTDIDLNVLVKNGKIEWYGFVENLPALQPGFLEDGSICHHSITIEEQKEIVSYMQNILELSNIKTACLHVEFRIEHSESDFSFTLIEINFRMGGVENFSFHLGRDNHDLVRSNIELAFDLPLSQSRIPLKSGIYPYMQNGNIYSHKTGILVRTEPPQIHPNIIEYLFYNPDNMVCSFPPGPNDDIAWIVAASRTNPQEVSEALSTALKEIVIDIQ